MRPISIRSHLNRTAYSKRNETSGNADVKAIINGDQNVGVPTP